MSIYNLVNHENPKRFSLNVVKMFCMWNDAEGTWKKKIHIRNEWCRMYLTLWHRTLGLNGNFKGGNPEFKRLHLPAISNMIFLLSLYGNAFSPVTFLKVKSKVKVQPQNSSTKETRDLMTGSKAHEWRVSTLKFVPLTSGIWPPTDFSIWIAYINLKKNHFQGCRLFCTWISFMFIIVLEGLCVPRRNRIPSSRDMP